MERSEGGVYPVSRGQNLGGNGTLVMGILNVTPDSFSDGGKWLEPKRAIDHALAMYDQGATIVDVGGESTRPGAVRVTPEQEWERVREVVTALTRRGLLVSIDTVNSQVAEAAVEEGVALINDVSGGRYDPAIAHVCAAADVAMVVQHWRGFPADPNLNQEYGDTVGEVVGETMSQVRDLSRAGVPGHSLVIDPGLGFAKGVEDSWTLLENLDAFTATGFPVLVGASRKRFVVARYGADERGTLETTKKAVQAGVWGIRVHDVEANVRLIEELS